ncbi:MAG TPA: GTPase ObgE [Firmicutes bacterium]|nr:GTPase ObgE [Bacillota bacterium]
MFIDRAKITLVAGKGGDGAISFRHEKYVEFGGPNGGNGGRGGSIYFKASNSSNSLVNYRHAKTIKAESGEKGMAKKMYGRGAKDIILEVPVGTMVLDSNENPLADLSKEGMTYLAAKGGRGGRGNACFVSSTHRTPKVAENGLPGEEKELILELKLLADVGLVGLPSVGKSSLLNIISNAHPLVAEYHFTTLEPNLGVVRIDSEKSMVVADLPGLIEGASRGKGLGLTFLRHIERCRAIIHIVDISNLEEDPIENFETINKELASYRLDLTKRPMVIALNKCDLLENRDAVERFKKAYKDKYEIFEISTVTKENVSKLMQRVYTIVQNTPFFPLYKEKQTDEMVLKVENTKDSDIFDIKVDNKGRYIIIGDRVIRTYRLINISEYEGFMKLLKYLDKIGVERKLRELGAKDGSTVILDDFEFEYFE